MFIFTNKLIGIVNLILNKSRASKGATTRAEDSNLRKGVPVGTGQNGGHSPEAACRKAQMDSCAQTRLV